MPSNSKEYVKKNYSKYYKNDKTREKSKLRMRALRKYKKSNGSVPKGKELDHKKGLGAGNGSKNLRVISKLKNRSLGAKKAIAIRKKRKNLGGKY